MQWLKLRLQRWLLSDAEAERRMRTLVSRNFDLVNANQHHAHKQIQELTHDVEELRCEFVRLCEDLDEYVLEQPREMVSDKVREYAAKYKGTSHDDEVPF